MSPDQTFSMLTSLPDRFAMKYFDFDPYGGN
jgi:hypothetical protein